jgi:hypothetical protein
LAQILEFAGFSETHQRLQLPIFLVDDLGVLEVVCQLKCSLIPCIADMAYFGGFVAFPLLFMELVVEVPEIAGIDKINKSIAHITIILHIIRVTSLSMGR